MSAVFNALPGMEVPVGEINSRLDAMWRDTAESGAPSLTAEDAKATQVNFVLHLGFKTTPEDGARQFATVVRFAQRYPSRIVVLCPIADEAHSTGEMRAKIYGECFLGKSKSDKRCVEFVVLSYPVSARRFLEDQVSICLSVDLPLYYWAHRFSASGRLADYQYLLRRARRVMLDSAIAPEDALTYAWPQPDALRDLAFARLLPVRQSIGQFLASYPPETLAGDLKSVVVAHSADLTAEARALLRWLRQRVSACGAAAEVAYELTPAAQRTRWLGIDFAYGETAKRFHWEGDLGTQEALFEARYAGATTRLPAAVSVLSPEGALSEAMFF
jgi:glucose-6-phosphate dehydrogenase assembly protein OpcA